jgi:hypothetical protein
MLAFLSWSGQRSKSVAVALEKWLGQVIQAVEPWISVDIEKGARWGPEISDRLEQSRVGILCLTRENLESRWVLFEAGALSKAKDAYVCTLLIGITASDVEPPLSQFQHTTTDKSDMLRLLRAINSAVAKEGERALTEQALSEIFDTFWPSLEGSIKAALASAPIAVAPLRPQNEVLEEILTTVRNLERRLVSEDSKSDRFEEAGLADVLRGTSMAAPEFSNLFLKHEYADVLKALKIYQRALAQYKWRPSQDEPPKE